MEFNKEVAFDEFSKAIQMPLNPTPSEAIKSLQRGQDFLEKLYLDAYKEGLEKGISKIETENEN